MRVFRVVFVILLTVLPHPVASFLGFAVATSRRPVYFFAATPDNNNHLDRDGKTSFLTLTCKGLIQHDGTERSLSIPQALTLTVEQETTEWVTMHFHHCEENNPETVWIPVRVPPHETNDSVLVSIRAASCIRLSLARLAVVVLDKKDKSNNYSLCMADPALDDPFPVVQSVIHPKGADSVNIIGDLTGTMRIYTNCQPSHLLYYPGDIVAAVRVKHKMTNPPRG